MGEVKIRAANALDVRSLYDGPAKRSMRAVAVVVDNVPLGLGGIYYEDERAVAFSRMKPELRAYPWAIYKAARLVMDMAQKRGCPLFAVADKSIPRSREFLEHLGFESPDGEVYQWISTPAPIS